MKAELDPLMSEVTGGLRSWLGGGDKLDIAKGEFEDVIGLCFSAFRPETITAD